MDEELTRFAGRCPSCGRALAADAAEGLCAACLLAAGTETLTTSSGRLNPDSTVRLKPDSTVRLKPDSTVSMDDTPTMSSASGQSAVADTSGPRLAEGQSWGDYRIGRLLGRGGMGEVYEAEHAGSGRRVALKVLRSRLQNADDRARFLREGQLAASVSHPHTVYIFGSEEISGMPVISMELLPGGTLKDLIVAQGPRPPAEAVAAVLDIIGGLDAAQAAGILHRDIKPSNCFVDRDGTVKVGDFGLSVSTLARDVHHDFSTSGFEGTPQFAPPEQLRGEPLDVRADIYAVGATLYYLLTGQPPLDAPDLRELFARVTTELPKSPRVIRPEIPPRLAAVVMQCLAKTPSERPQSYAALADALRPFSSREDAPARLGTRLIAGALDSWVIIGVPAAVWTVWVNDPVNGTPDRTVAIATWIWLVTFGYYLLLEGLQGASLGKRLFGLRVIAADGSSASWRQIAIRTSMFHLPSVLAALAFLAGLLAPGFMAGTVRPAVLVALSAALFFSTARRHNGWTGLHDVASRTRVVARPTAHSRWARQVQTTAASVLPTPAAHRYGPFIVLDDGHDRSAGGVLRAFDPVLRREVWIHIVPPSMPPIGGTRRDLSRTGRLHWLTGRRSAGENWDAYEAPDGVPFASGGSSANGWPARKRWLLELANELTSAEREGTVPPLGLDRLWIRDDGRLVLLDFAAPGAPVEASVQGTATPVGLLAAVAAPSRDGGTAMANGPGPLPLSARALVDRWAAPSPPTLDETRGILASLAAGPDRVHSWRRGVPIALAASPVALMLLISVLMVPSLSQFTNSDRIAMLRLLGALQVTNPPPASPMANPDVRHAAEVYVAGRYRDVIRSEDFWNSGVMRELGREYRPLAEEILERHPSVSAEALADAEAALARARPGGGATGRREASALALGAVIISVVTAGALGLVVVCSLISSLVVPGGVVPRTLGLAMVTRSGQEITRVRSVARVLVASVPAAAWFAYLVMSPRVQGFVPTPTRPLLATGVTVGVLAAGAIWTIVRPIRGPHDWLTRTWVIPR